MPGPGPINPFMDFMKGAGDVISSALPGMGLVTGAIGTIGNLIGGNVANQQNYENQGALLDYQRKMQQTAWQREDTAVQRRVADLKAAGLSPVLAAGNAASSSSPINVTAPQRSYTPIDTNQLGMLNAMAQISQSKAQAALTMIEAEKQRWNLDYYKRNDLPTDGDPMIKKISQVLEQVFGHGALPKAISGVVDVAKGATKSYTDSMKGISSAGYNIGKSIRNIFTGGK